MFLPSFAKGPGTRMSGQTLRASNLSCIFAYFCGRSQKQKVRTNGTCNWSPGLIVDATCAIFGAAAVPADGTYAGRPSAGATPPPPAAARSSKGQEPVPPVKPANFEVSHTTGGSQPGNRRFGGSGPPRPSWLRELQIGSGNSRASSGSSWTSPRRLALRMLAPR